MNTSFLGKLLSLVFVLIVSGCTDAFVGDETGLTEGPVDTPSYTSPTAPAAEGKLRNAHLMDQALDSQAGKDGTTTTSMNLIFSINKQEVLERFSVLERYKVIERYEVFERFEYNNVIGGYAVTVVDTTGLGEYTAFLQALEADPDIAWYEPDFNVNLPDAQVSQGVLGQQVPWSVAAIGGQESWAASGDGMGAVEAHVFVLDTGVAKADANDPNDDLRLGESYNLVGAASGAADMDGHGTHVAGIIGSIDDGDGLVGVAPGAYIHNVKVLGDDGTADVSVVVAAVEAITVFKLTYPHVPFVVNMSLGENTGSPYYTALDVAVEQATAAGVIFVAAAGNHGTRVANVTPARVPGVITVGAYDQHGFHAYYSNYGPEIDILAPGSQVLSLSHEGAATGSVKMSGTSMAAAHVTGAVALYLAQHPAATLAEVEAHLHAKSKRLVMGTPRGTTNRSVWVGH